MNAAVLSPPPVTRLWSHAQYSFGVARNFQSVRRRSWRRSSRSGTRTGSDGPRRPNPLLDCRRRPIGQLGRSVVGQALEIGPDQGVLGRRWCPALAAIDLRGQHDDQIAIRSAVDNSPPVPGSNRWQPFIISSEQLQPGVDGRDQPAGHPLWGQRGLRPVPPYRRDRPE